MVTQRTGSGGKVHSALAKGLKMLVDDNQEICREASRMGMELYPITTKHMRHSWWTGTKYTDLTAVVEELLQPP